MVDRRSKVFYFLSFALDRLLLRGMLSLEWKCRLDRNQILKNLAHMADRQRIMSFVFNESRFAIRKTVCDFFRQPNGESAIFYSMPKSHRHAYVFDRKPPWLRINPCVGQYAFHRTAPGAPLAFENRFKSCVVVQAGRVARAQ